MTSHPSFYARAKGAGLTRRVNSAEGLASGFLTGKLGDSLASWSTLKVKCLHLIEPGMAFWLASRLRSFSAGRCLIMSVE